MASDALLAQLLFGNSQKPLIEASDPYLGFQNEVANPIASAVLGAQGPGVKTSDKIIGSLITGLFSGAAEGFSNDYQERATNTYRSTLMGIPIGEALKGSPNIQRPDILSQDVFSQLKDQAGMFAVIKNAETQDLAREKLRDLQKQAASYEKIAITSPDPLVRDRARDKSNELNLLLGIKAPELESTGATNAAASTAPSEAYLAPGGGAELKAPTTEAASKTPLSIEELTRKHQNYDVAKQIYAEQVKDSMKSWREKLPAAVTEKISLSKATIDEADTLADFLGNTDMDWVDLQGAKLFTGLDTNGIGQMLMNLSDRLTRARTGAALNETEQKVYGKMLKGDITAGPKAVANVLRKLGEAERRINTSQLSFLEDTPGEFSDLIQKFNTKNITKLGADASPVTDIAIPKDIMNAASKLLEQRRLSKGGRVPVG